LAVWPDPHAGHGGLASLDIDRTSWSNRLLHDWQVYS
jgi:hypothetical protein